MNILKTAVLIIGIIIVVGGAYTLGLQRGGAPSPQASAPDAETLPAAPASPETASKEIRLKPPGRQNIKFTHFRVGNRNVKTMLADGNTLWVGTSGGVIRYDIAKDDYQLYDIRAGLLSNGIFHLSKWGDRIMVGTYGGGLSIYDPANDSWENVNIQHGLADSFIYDVLVLDDGDVWIATWSGANRIRGGDFFDPSKWETYTVENTSGGLINDWVYGLAKGKNGEVWMATEGGLSRFQDEQWTNWNHSDGLGAPYELVRDQIQFMRDPAKESSHHARQKVEMGLTDVDVAYNPNYIVALHVTKDGIVWCGTWGGGLARFDGENWTYFTVKDGLPSNHVFMLGPERNGRIWVGTGDGLARFDGKTFTTFNLEDGLYSKSPFSMANTDEGSLWVAGFGGVAKLRGFEDAE